MTMKKRERELEQITMPEFATASSFKGVKNHYWAWEERGEMGRGPKIGGESHFGHVKRVLWLFALKPKDFRPYFTANAQRLTFHSLRNTLISVFLSA